MEKELRKVLLVAHWLPSPHKPGRGVFIVEHAKAMQVVDLEPRIFSLQFESGSSFKSRWRIYKLDEIPCIEFCLYSPVYKLMSLWPSLWWPFYRKRVMRKLKEFYPEVQLIHSQVLLPAGIIGSAVAKSWSLPHYLTEHWSKAPEFISANLYRFSHRAAVHALQNTKAISMVSAYALKAFSRAAAQKNIELPRICVIPNVVQIPEIDEKELAYPEAGKPFRLLSIANWNKSKNITKRPDIIIDTLKKLCRVAPQQQWHLTVVGQGDMLPEIKRELTKLPISTDYPGFIAKSELSKLYCNHHLLIHASNIETFSLVVAEALGHGLPVVASKVGAIPELVNHESKGLLVRNIDLDFSQAIEKMSQQYPASRIKIAKSQNLMYNKNKVGRQLQDFYRP